MVHMRFPFTFALPILNFFKLKPHLLRFMWLSFLTFSANLFSLLFFSLCTFSFSILRTSQSIVYFSCTLSFLYFLVTVSFLLLTIFFTFSFSIQRMSIFSVLFLPFSAPLSVPTRSLCETTNLIQLILSSPMSSPTVHSMCSRCFSATTARRRCK